ncbi:alpha/beta fold hydrolase [Paraglaciecola hydrolytica]|uniref:Alpha/beta hydrolase n=1 Tax=Paraglaciecola hydrolytica TaxID=1799789 RepID=A0A148KKW5_9ALTE|nr:alpha/beta hydrolase [Paraglaciecola hydrolytica]KXI26937.1 alpha/beta hydrolase [Paraglaciecola hydrolytica]
MKLKLQTLKRWCIRLILTLVMLILAIVAVGYWLTPQPVNFNSPYHPFKSIKAKSEYLEVYDKRALKWPVASSELIIETSQGKTFIRISGAENSSPIVLLHGSGGNSLQWMSIIAKLSTEHKVFAVDIMFDNGRSVPQQEFSKAENYILWLNEVIQQISPLQKVNMVGLSYGGWIAAQYAQHYPDQLEKVVLLAPAGVVAHLSNSFIARAVSVMLPSQYFTKRFMYWLAQDTYLQGQEKRQLLNEHIDEAYLAIRSFTSRQMVYPNVFTDQELANLKVPVLFVVGENEKIYSADLVLHRLKTVAPMIKTKLISGAGHDLTMAKPNEVAISILDFIN